MSKSLVRSIKNVTNGYTNAQVKVRNATSNDPWGPSGTDMNEIAQLTFDNATLFEVLDMIDKRLNDKGKNWRHVMKALVLLDYCLHVGSENVVLWCKDNAYIIKTLREFQYVDEEGRDQGANVRSKAKELTTLLQDDERIRTERANRNHMRDKMSQPGDDIFRERPEQQQQQQRRRRNTVGDRRAGRDDAYDDDLRLAIEQSKLTAENEDQQRRGNPRDRPEDDDLARAIKLSEEEEAKRQQKEYYDVQNTNLLFDPVQDQQQQQQQYYQEPQNNNNNDLYNVFGAQQQVYQPTGYQPQGNDLFASAQQTVPTGYLQNAYAQPTGFTNQFGFQQPQPQPQPLQSQDTASLKPGSNNPFSQFGQTAKPESLSSLSLQSPSLNELAATKSNSAPQSIQGTGIGSNPQYAKLNQLLATGEGIDTFGNTGDLRIPSIHTARGNFVNSAGIGGTPAQTQSALPTGYGFQNPQATGYLRQSNSPFGIQQNVTNSNALFSQPQQLQQGPAPLTQTATGYGHQPVNDGVFNQQQPQQQGNNFFQSLPAQPQPTGYGFQQQQQQPQQTGFAGNPFGSVQVQPQQQAQQRYGQQESLI
ncbi:ENTH-domain-containing protein [Lipomyces japonicus]|uniref:ENTH-domain-containing protein n=1 Tax=Lipomyces japonicus TaxID=56871 RepID=UPI0034CDFF80